MKTVRWDIPEDRENRKIAYQKKKDVVGNYKKIEDGVVGTYKKIENAFVDKFLDEKED